MVLGSTVLFFSTTNIPCSEIIDNLSLSNIFFGAVFEVITSGIPKKIFLLDVNFLSFETVSMSFSHDIKIFAFL